MDFNGLIIRHGWIFYLAPWVLFPLLLIKTAPGKKILRFLIAGNYWADISFVILPLVAALGTLGETDLSTSGSLFVFSLSASVFIWSSAIRYRFSGLYGGRRRRYEGRR
jgi:hypothetical protein